MTLQFQCPCGSTTFWRNYTAKGTWRQIVEAAPDGFQVMDTDIDGLRYTSEPKYLKCTDCGKRVRNPQAEPNEP